MQYIVQCTIRSSFSCIYFQDRGRHGYVQFDCRPLRTAGKWATRWYFINKKYFSNLNYFFHPSKLFFQFSQSRRMKNYMIIVGTKGHIRWLFSPQVTNKECNRGIYSFLVWLSSRLLMYHALAPPQTLLNWKWQVFAKEGRGTHNCPTNWNFG